jgi:hypothetical protein
MLQWINEPPIFPTRFFSVRPPAVVLVAVLQPQVLQPERQNYMPIDTM